MDRVSTFGRNFGEAEQMLAFQSLVRDGSCFNARRELEQCGLDRFNPSFGMDRVSTLRALRSMRDGGVSIPRSGWIVFQRHLIE